MTMSDFLEVKAMKIEIASGLGMEGSTVVLVDTLMEEIDNEDDAQKLADWLWRAVPYRTLDSAIKELERKEKNEEE
jgi:hypothetical protein